MTYAMIVLSDIVQTYLDKLEYVHPYHRSIKFEDNVAAKWACKELLNDIYKVDELPFDLTPDELLDHFIEKMKRYACEHDHKEHTYLFAKAADTAEFISEEYWQSYN